MKLWIVPLVVAVLVVGPLRIAAAQGQERKDFVEWCESRGARYNYDDRRANFLDKCLAEHDVDRGGKAPLKNKD